MDERSSDSQTDGSIPSSARRGPDALYREGRIVARVLEPESDLEARQVRFGEVYLSGELLLCEECEFQKYRIMVQKIAWAVRVDGADPSRGRVLKGVAGDLRRYRQQQEFRGFQQPKPFALHQGTSTEVTSGGQTRHG